MDVYIRQTKSAQAPTYMPDRPTDQPRGSQSVSCRLPPNIYEVKLSNLPFCRKSSFANSHKRPVTDEQVTKEALRSLCERQFDNDPTDRTWFNDLQTTLIGHPAKISKEDLALCLLDEMNRTKLLPAQDGMSMLFDILAPSRHYKFPARCTLFAAAVYQMSLATLQEEIDNGSYIIHYAARLGYRSIIQLMSNWGLSVNTMATLTGDTPLLAAVRPKDLNKDVIGNMVEVLMQCGADESVNTENKAGDTPLQLAVLAGHRDVVNQLLMEGADRFKTDSDGNTILHLAAQVNAPEICKLIMEKSPEYFVCCRNSDGKTPIHIAAMHSPECLGKIVDGLKTEKFVTPDDNGHSPMDIAATAGQKATFKMMWKKMDESFPAQVEVERSDLEFFIKRVENDPSQWRMLAGYLQGFPKTMLHRLFSDDPTCTDGNTAQSTTPTFHRLITASGKNIAQDYHQQHQDAVRAVLDSSLFGDKVIVPRTLDGVNINPTASLTALLTKNLQIWDHKAVTLWLNYKLKTAWIWILFYFALYYTFLGTTCGALELAASINATSGQLMDYSNDSSARYGLEVASLFLWLLLLIPDISDAIRYRLPYWNWLGVYPRVGVNLCFICLLATRLAGSNLQWIFASLLIIASVLRAMEIFALFEWSNAYLVTLGIIVRRELLKFLLIALLFIFAFSVALRFALQAERDELSRLQITATNQSHGCTSMQPLLANDTNTTCVEIDSLSEQLAGYLLGELESVQRLFHANFYSLAGGPSELYSGMKGYELFTSILYLTFIGVVVLLLVSVFIAQTDYSYSSVQDLSCQMANYSSARLLTQTSTMLPILLFNYIKKTRRSEDSSYYYVWSDWPLDEYAVVGADGKAPCYGCCHRLVWLLQCIWRILKPEFVSETSFSMRYKRPT